MEKELLIDAIYINNSGGKILLDYLIQEIEKTGKKVFYLLDQRVEDTVPYLDKSKGNILFLKASLLSRHKFYTANKNRFNSVICFGDLPPSIKLNAKVYTYFHQQLYIAFPNDTPFRHKILFTLKRNVLRYLFPFTDYWMLQTETIANSFQKKFNVDKNKLLVLPFYPTMGKISTNFKTKNSYVYVSNAAPHKNHIRLINGFCLFYDRHKKGELTITIDHNFPDLLELIKTKNALNYPIKNIGFVKRTELNEIYQKAEFLVFPSLAESFGLGIVEAIEYGCNVIGSDLPYMHAVCEPSLTFNPVKEESICDAFEKSLHPNLKSTKGLLKDKIIEVITILYQS